MKKGFVSQIHEQRDLVMRVQQTIAKVLLKEQEVQQSKQMSNQVKSSSYLKLQQQKNQNIKRIVQSLHNHVEKLKIHSVRYLVYLIATQILNTTLDIMQKVFTKNNKIYFNGFDNTHEDQLKKYQQQAYTLISKIYRFSMKHVPDFLQNFCKKQLYQYMEQKALQNKEQIAPDEIKQEVGEAYLKKQEQKQKRIRQFKIILDKISEIVVEKQKSNTVINQAFKMVMKYESQDERGDDIYEQIAVNWLKYQLDDSRKQKDNYCCKSVFFLDQLFEYVKKKNFQFRPFTKTQEYPKLTQQQQQLSTTIAAFMNQKGGVIFLGVNYDSRFYKIAGFQLEEKNKKQLVKHIRNSVNQVYPKHKGFEKSAEESQHYYNAAYELNYYISIEFLNVVRRNTFQNCRDPTRTYQKLYICKITVKIGHPRYFYYVLKNEGNKDDKKQAQIQIYCRTQEGNSKQTLQKSYDEIYKKLTDYETDKKILKLPIRPPMHDGCLYDMSMKAEKFILDTPEIDEDDD